MTVNLTRRLAPALRFGRRAALGFAAVCALAGCETIPVPADRYLVELHTGSTGSPTVEVAMDLFKDPDADHRWEADLINGDERLAVPRTVQLSDREFRFDFPHYDSQIQLEFFHNKDAGTWAASGNWTKFRGDSGTANVFVSAKPIIDRDVSRRGPIHTERDLAAEVAGRWSIDFTDSGSAIAEIEINRDGFAQGTILTPTGDYRYLAGRFDPKLPRRSAEARRRVDDRPPGELYLSTFDGGHMFAIHATLSEITEDRPLTMIGTFHSGDWWVESFIAKKDPDATLPSALDLSEWQPETPLDQLVYTNLEGQAESVAQLIQRVHADQASPGPTIVEVFGSWCPNCHDAAEYLAELQAVYGPRGLRTVGLAFELTPDLDRSIEQVRTYQDKHSIEWPILVAGLSDKSKASEAFPALDRVRAYPTFIFMDRTGAVQSVYTGFSGPATGEAHETLRSQFQARIEALLAE